MTHPKFLISYLLCAAFGCNQPLAKHKVDPAVFELSNKAGLLVAFIDNADSSKKAVSLLDQATTIDPQCYLCYYNKLMFLDQLKLYEKAILTIDKLIQLRPFAHDLYLTAGILYEKKGDTVTSQKYFQRSLSICNKVLDTIKSDHSNFLMVIENKAIALTMLNRPLERDMMIQGFANKLYDENLFDSVAKKTLNALYDHTKKQIIGNSN